MRVWGRCVAATALMLGCVSAFALTGNGDSRTNPLATVSPTLNAVSAVTDKSLSVTFSAPMLAAGATTPANYAVSGLGEGTLAVNPSVVAGNDPFVLTWGTGEMRNGATVTVTATGVQDILGNPIDPLRDSVSCAGLAIPPTFTNLSAQPAQAATGDTVAITFTASETLDGNPIVTVNGHDATFASAGRYEYVVGTSDALGMADVSISGFDLAGNHGSVTSNGLLEIVLPKPPLPLMAWPAGIGLLLAGVLALAWKRRRSGTVLLLALMLLAASAAVADAPAVSNVTFIQSPSASGTQVDIYYDLVAPNGPCAITVWLSKDGGADGFAYPVTSITGNVTDVTVGTGRHIVWDIRADYPEQNIPQARIRVTADDGLIQYTLTYTAGANGSISGISPQTVNRGADGAPMTAVPDTGYHFVQWSDSSTQNPRADTNNTATITVAAMFAINTYALAYTAEANGSLSGTSPQTVNYGGSGTAVTAVANTGYHFVQWNDSSTQNPRTDTNDTASITVAAMFAINTYVLAYTAEANGALSGASAQTVNYGGSGTAVTAVANTGYHFVQWNDSSTQNPRTDTNVTDNISVTASLAINQYTLTLAPPAHGALAAVESPPYSYGDTVHLMATPDPCYEVASWAGVDSLSGNQATAVMTSDRTVSATFVPISYTLTLTPPANGALAAVETAPYICGEVVHLLASAVAGYHVRSWIGADTEPSTANTNTVTMIGNLVVTVSFAIDTFTLEYAAGANGTISGISPQTVDYAASGTAVTAVPAIGCHFVQWSDSSTQNPRTDSNVTANMSITATFAINTYTLTYMAGANGTISGASPQTVTYGNTGTLVTAVPDTGYVFEQWSDGSTQNPRQDANVTADISATASFANEPASASMRTITGVFVSIAVTPDTSQGLTGYLVVETLPAGLTPTNISNAGTWNSAQRTVRWIFSDNNARALTYTVTGSGGLYTYIVSYSYMCLNGLCTPTKGNMVLNIPFTLVYTAGTNGSISGAPSQTVNYGGAGSAVTAVSNTGYYFSQWTEGSTQNPRTDANVTGNVSVTAAFAPNP